MTLFKDLLYLCFIQKFQIRVCLEKGWETDTFGGSKHVLKEWSVQWKDICVTMLNEKYGV